MRKLAIIVFSTTFLCSLSLYATEKKQGVLTWEISCQRRLLTTVPAEEAGNPREPLHDFFAETVRTSRQIWSDHGPMNEGWAAFTGMLIDQYSSLTLPFDFLMNRAVAERPNQAGTKLGLCGWLCIYFKYYQDAGAKPSLENDRTFIRRGHDLLRQWHSDHDFLGFAFPDEVIDLRNLSMEDVDAIAARHFREFQRNRLPDPEEP